MNNAQAAFFDTGTVIDGKWVLLERIGKGGMGVVYRAHQLNLKRDVAIKLIATEFLADLEDNPQEVENLRARFEREVQSMAQVRHPNVLQIFDFGALRHPDDPSAPPVEYIVMEYVPGNTLRFTMSEDGFEGEDDLLADWVRAYFLPVLDGVAAIHARGIVHRDLKPENVLMDGDTPKIADFGLSRSVQMRAVSNSWDVKGTWPYMAPEQFSDFRRAGPAADIYSLGKILYEGAAGTMDPQRLPFKAAALENPDTPAAAAVDAVIRRATHEDADARFQSVGTMRRALEELVREAGAPLPETAARPLPKAAAPAWARTTWIGVALALLAVFGMTVYHLWERPPADRAGTPPIPAVESPSAPRPTALPEGAPPERLRAADGRTLRRVTDPVAGNVFYAAPALVTYHHYVEFLNSVVDQLAVSEGIVRNGEDIWIYIGDEGSPREPIRFADGRFQLRSAEKAPEPVVRVTWQGARAYAAYFGMHLPTYYQWRMLHGHPGMSPAAEPPPPGPAAGDGHGHMMGGTAGNHMGGGSVPEIAETLPAVKKEWVAFSEERARAGVADWASEPPADEPVRRHAWEGFEDVGFRTVLGTG